MDLSDSFAFGRSHVECPVGSYRHDKVVDAKANERSKKLPRAGVGPFTAGAKLSARQAAKHSA